MILRKKAAGVTSDSTTVAEEPPYEVAAVKCRLIPWKPNFKRKLDQMVAKREEIILNQ